MSTATILILAFVVLFIGFIVYSQRKMKKMPEVKSSERIINLSNKNFKAATSRGLVLVDFWAAWCGPCKMMSPVLNDVAEEAGDQAKVAKVNVDHNQDLAKRFKIRSIPTLVLLRDGVEINRYVGLKQKKFLLQELRRQG
ncbi:MAG: thioredoxin [Bacteroidales bacterium]